MTLAYRDYIEQYRLDKHVYTWAEIWRRMVCDLSHTSYKFVELGFNGVDEIWCTKCGWRRREYRPHYAVPKEQEFPEEAGGGE